MEQLPGTTGFALKRVQDQSWGGEQGGSGHLPRFPLAAGGAEHHRSAWENSGDADRLWLRSFSGRGYNQHSVCSLTSPAFMSARCQLCSATPHCSGLCSQSPSRASTLPKHLSSFLGSPLLCPWMTSLLRSPLSPLPVPALTIHSPLHPLECQDLPLGCVLAPLG